MAEMLKRTRAEARAMVTRDLVARDVCITSKEVKNAIDILRGATMIVYPMGLPPHDPIKLELENHEDLSGTQVTFSFLMKTIYITFDLFAFIRMFFSV